MTGLTPTMTRRFIRYGTAVHEAVYEQWSPGGMYGACVGKVIWTFRAGTRLEAPVIHAEYDPAEQGSLEHARARCLHTLDRWLDGRYFPPGAGADVARLLEGNR